MKEKIKELHERLDKADGNITDEIRRDIANLIANSLDQKREVLDYWEKDLFSRAIAYLRDGQFKLCLSCIENASTPLNMRSKEDTEIDSKINALTFFQLMTEIRKLCGYA